MHIYFKENRARASGKCVVFKIFCANMCCRNLADGKQKKTWKKWIQIVRCSFQIGRSSESPIDFVVMDTLPGDKKDTKVMQSTISRFACRILVNRESTQARVYAAGFDSSRNIFLGVSMNKWHFWQTVSVCTVHATAADSKKKLIILHLFL